MIKSSDELGKNNKNVRKNRGNAQNWKNNIFLNQYKIIKISAKTCENNGVEVIVHDTLSLNEKHLEDKLGHKNLLAATKKYIQFIKSIDMN